MGHETLAVLRLVTPGLIALTAYKYAGQLTGLWSFEIEWSVDAIYKSGPGLIVALLYYISPFRRWSNDPFMGAINEYIRAEVVKISGLADSPNRFAWKKVKIIFFGLIDKDASLEKKASLIRLNGYILTTLADIRVIAILMAIPAAISVSLLGLGPLLVLIACLAIAALSLPISQSLMRAHIARSEEQLEIMRQQYKVQIRNSLESLE